jgi:NAD-dependent dihydropyrimidine dehydrogenase PreA subunit
MANVNQQLCIGCEKCIPYCPMGAISVEADCARIDQKECVECGVCFENPICPVGALEAPVLEWPRVLRAEFSNPRCVHKTGVPGRGTEEMKTNDVTDRFKIGEVGLGVEMGRPGTGTTFRDLEKVSRAFAAIEGVVFEEKNPVAPLMAPDGSINPEALDEKVLSGIVEINFPLAKTREVLQALKDVEPTLETVCSVCMVTRVYPDGSRPPLDIAREMGVFVSPNCKTNIGLGRID